MPVITSNSLCITSGHRTVQFSLPLKLSFRPKEFNLLFSLSNGRYKPAVLITYIVYRLSSWIRKAEHVPSMKTHIPEPRRSVVTPVVQTVPQTLDWLNRFISRYFLSYCGTTWENEKFWEECLTPPFLSMRESTVYDEASMNYNFHYCYPCNNVNIKNIKQTGSSYHNRTKN
jgi:hypothetical protein